LAALIGVVGLIAAGDRLLVLCVLLALVPAQAASMIAIDNAPAAALRRAERRAAVVLFAGRRCHLRTWVLFTKTSAV
jgi:hypothetical protein